MSQPLRFPTGAKLRRRGGYLAAIAATTALLAVGSTYAFAEDTRNPDAADDSPTLCGSSFMVEPEYGDKTYQDAFERLDDRYGLESVRVFYSGLPRHWPGRLDSGDLTMTVSFKADPTEITSGAHDGHLTRWFDEAPTDRDIYWSYYHEPEDNIEKGQFTAAQYRAAWGHLAQLAKDADNPRLSATLILMGWSLEPGSERNWRDYFAGTDAIDVLAWDTYNDVHADPDRYRSPAELFGKSVKVNEEIGLPFAIAETGSDLVPGDDGRQRAAWIAEMTEYLTQNNALWVQYFDIDFSEYGYTDFRIRDRAGQDAWQDFCAT